MIKFEVVTEMGDDFEKDVLRQIGEQMAAELRKVKCDQHGSDTGEVIVQLRDGEVAVSTVNACCEAYGNKIDRAAAEIE